MNRLIYELLARALLQFHAIFCYNVKRCNARKFTEGTLERLKVVGNFGDSKIFIQSGVNPTKLCFLRIFWFSLLSLSVCHIWNSCIRTMKWPSLITKMEKLSLPSKNSLVGLGVWSFCYSLIRDPRLQVQTTERIKDLDKLNLVKLAYGGKVLSLSWF